MSTTEQDIIDLTQSDDTMSKRLGLIEARNLRVEAEKKWEGSWYRKALIMACTYVVVFFYNWSIGVQDPWLTAFVPPVGFLLSTLTFGRLRRRYVNHKVLDR